MCYSICFEGANFYGCAFCTHFTHKDVGSPQLDQVEPILFIHGYIFMGDISDQCSLLAHLPGDSVSLNCSHWLLQLVSLLYSCVHSYTKTQKK